MVQKVHKVLQITCSS